MRSLYHFSLSVNSGIVRDGVVGIVRDGVVGRVRDSVWVVCPYSVGMFQCMYVCMSIQRWYVLTISSPRTGASTVHYNIILIIITHVNP